MLVCQMIIYLLFVSIAASRKLQIKVLKKSIFNSHSLKIQIIISKYKYGVLQESKIITTGSFWFVKILFLSGPSQEMHYFGKLEKPKL